MESYLKIKDNLLYKGDALFLVLPSTIKKVLTLDNSVVILVDSNPLVKNQNVFCYDFNNLLKWQVPLPVEFHQKNDFTGIYIEGIELYAYNRNGVEYHLDKETGENLDSQLIK